MEYIDQGTHCGTRIIFTVSKRNDGTYSGDIRVLNNPKHTFQIASPMADTLQIASTRDEVLELLSADLKSLIGEAK